MATKKGKAPSKGLKVGFVGLGVMGAPMAGHLVRAGHSLTLNDSNLGASQRLADELGAQATAVATPREVAARSDIVVTMLPNGEVVQSVTFGDDGLLAGWREGGLLLDTSSSQPWLTLETARELGARGIAMVDAPVSGAQWGAQAAELVFMAGGASSDLDRVQPLLKAMGREVFHLGAVGCGHAMKCINNLITAMTFSATCEGLVIGKRFGLDPAEMVRVLNESTGMSWISQTHIEQRVLNRKFDDPFKLELMLKDIGIANALARETATPAPISALGQQLWQAASRSAGPGASISELARWIEQQSGARIEPGAVPHKD
jgi:3-hydroxyisobutyrate dehydrogenase-like beta-hydroxyacid dehydrogenase